MSYKIAGIDVHKRMLAVVVADIAGAGEYQSIIVSRFLQQTYQRKRRP
jgi:hypothetical protein